MRFATQAVHAGELEAHFGGAVAIPIFQSANYLSQNEKDYHGIKYIRLNNSPNHDVLHAKLSALEGGEAALVTASGMAAISTTLLALLKTGDHILAQRCLYGGTIQLLQHDLSDFGISVTWIDIHRPETWLAHLRPTTRAIYTETIGNPLTEIGALGEVASFAKQQGLISLIDNTIATPLFCKPLSLGFDIVLHSATKYLNGHSDIVGGAVVSSRKFIDRIKTRLDHLGGSMDPHACFLLNRGIKTLAVRMRQHQASALTLAKFLEDHPKVEKVFYPGLESHPQHQAARKFLSGTSGLLGFEHKGTVAEVERFLRELKIPLVAASLGGAETLITRPAASSHLGLSPEQRMEIGIKDTTVRVSVGIEDTEDLLEDFARALD